MSRTQRELWANLVAPQFGGPVFPVTVVLTPGTTNNEAVVFVAPRDVAIRRGYVASAADLSGAVATLTVENLTDTEDLSSEFDLSALEAGDSAALTFVAAADKIDEGDVVILDYDSDTDPGELVVVLEVEFLELKND